MNKLSAFKGLIALFVISFAAFIYLMNVGINERHEMKNDIQKLGVMIDSSTSLNEHLKSQVHILTKENDSLRQIAGKSSVKRSVSRMGLNKYKVRTYSNTPNTQVIKEIDVYLYGEGYNILLGKNYNTRPTWLSKQPTVYYHSEKTKRLAQKIALDIKDITDIPFRVRRGKGDDVKPGEEDITIFIHYSTVIIN